MDLIQNTFLPIEGNRPLQNAAWALRTLLNNSCSLFFFIFNTIIFKDFRTVRHKIVQCSRDLDPSTKMCSCWLNFCSVFFKSITTLNPSISSQSCCLIDCHILTGHVPSGLVRVNQFSTGSRAGQWIWSTSSRSSWKYDISLPQLCRSSQPSLKSQRHVHVDILCSYSKHPSMINTEQLHHTTCCKPLIIEYHKSAQSHAQRLWFYVCSLVSSTIACGTSRICSFCLQTYFPLPLYLWGK